MQIIMIEEILHAVITIALVILVVRLRHQKHEIMSRLYFLERYQQEQTHRE